MSKQHPAMWSDTIELIRSRVSETQFAAFFRPVEFESYDVKTRKLTIQVPSKVFAEYFEENCLGVFGPAVTSVFGPGVILNYHILQQVAEQMPQYDVLQPRSEQQQPVAIDSNLNQQYNFKNFIEGQSNKLARAIGLSIAEHPRTTKYNPMFLFGPSGCGKTHLLNAIGLRTKELYPKKRVLYVSAREFQQQYTDAVVDNTTNDFIKFYQTLDMLMVDDIQVWASTKKTLEAFFHIFDHLFRNNKRIIMACDRPPAELQTMQERMITRFSCGVLTELERPNEQLCVDILNAKIKRDGLVIPQDVVGFIASKAKGSVRDLEGIINSLLAYSVVFNCDVDMALVEKVVNHTVKSNSKNVSIDTILEKVCEHYAVSVDDVCSNSRRRELVLARQVAMYLAAKNTNVNATRIGRLIGGRDHSTVNHSIDKITQKVKKEKDFAREVESIL